MIGKILLDIRERLKARLTAHAAKKWAKSCGEGILRFRREFAYVDVSERVFYRHPRRLSDGRNRKIEAIPTRLCRLRYLGSMNRWEFAFYKYSDECYALCYLRSGRFEGTPEECFDCAANVYLRH